MIAVAAIPVLAVGLVVFGRVGVRRVEREFPPIGRLVATTRGTMHVIEAGAGPVVVLVHGASANARDMVTALTDSLSAQCRVVAIDRPGYGYSERPAGAWCDPLQQADMLRAALAAIAIDEPVTLVGHSWGASVVLAWALAYPAQVRGVLTLAGATHPWPGAVALYRRVATVPWLGDAMAATLLRPLGSAMLPGGVAASLYPDAVPDRYIERTALPLLLRPGQFLADAGDVAHLSVFLQQQAPRYVGLSVPLTIITGDDDRVVSIDLHSRTLREQVKHARYVELAGAGHGLHHSRTAEVVAEILLRVGDATR